MSESYEEFLKRMQEAEQQGQLGENSRRTRENLRQNSSAPKGQGALHAAGDLAEGAADTLMSIPSALGDFFSDNAGPIAASTIGAADGALAGMPSRLLAAHGDVTRGINDALGISLPEADEIVRQVREENPTADTVGQIGGAVGSLFTGGGALGLLDDTVRGVTGAGNIGQRVAAATLSGAGEAASISDARGGTTAEVLNDTLVGALGGGAGQAVVGEAVLPLVQHAADNVGPMISSALRDGPPVGAPGSRMEAFADRRAIGAMQGGGEYAGKSDQTDLPIEDWARDLLPGQVLAEHPAAQKTVAAVARDPASTGQADALIKSVDEADARVAQDVASVIDDTLQEAMVVRDQSTLREFNEELGDQIKEASDEIGRQADSSQFEIGTQRLEDMVNQVFGGDGVVGDTPGRLRDRYIDMLQGERLKAVGESGERDVFNMRSLMEFRAEIGLNLDQLDGTQSVIRGEARKKAAELKRRTTDELRRIVKTLDEPMAEMAEGMLVREATIQGTKDFSMGAGGTLKNLEEFRDLSRIYQADQNPAVFNGYKVGFLTAMKQEVASAGGDRAFVQKHFATENSPLQQKMDVVLGPEITDKFRTLAKRIKDQETFAGTVDSAIRSRNAQPAADRVTRALDVMLGSYALWNRRASAAYPIKRVASSLNDPMVGSALNLLTTPAQDVPAVYQRMNDAFTPRPQPSGLGAAGGVVGSALYGD